MGSGSVFQKWYGEAETTLGAGCHRATLDVAMHLGMESRTVFNCARAEDDVTFFTTGSARQALMFVTASAAALTFTWQSLGRRVRLEGTLVALNQTEREAQFERMPRELQLTALIAASGGSANALQLLRALHAERLGLSQVSAVQLPRRFRGFRVRPERVIFEEAGRQRVIAGASQAAFVPPGTRERQRPVACL